MEQHLPTVAVHRDFIVIDDFLPDASFRSAREYLQSLEFKRTPAGASIWDADGSENPAQSVTTFAWLAPAMTRQLTAMPAGAIAMAKSAFQFCPSGAPVDMVFEQINEHLQSTSELIGHAGQQWVGILSSAFAYAAGARASWHQDHHDYTGAFIYYVHGRWEPDWGGDLLIEPAGEPRAGDGVFVRPLPNRLVVLRGSIRHCVTRVTATAGHEQRLSLAGFFVTHVFVNQLMSGL